MPCPPVPMILGSRANPSTAAAHATRTVTSIPLFDQHRLGRHERLGRDCLSPAEMEAKGWRKDKRGRWTDPAEIERGMESLARSLAGAPKPYLAPERSNLS